ncbi:MAG TPA: DUF1800 domain-containing protein [Terriglobales bacterium]
MKPGLRKSGASIFLLGLVVLAPLAMGKKKQPAATGMDERKRAIQALNRLTFGARPDDLDRVMSIGVDKWIDEQLHPEKISDSALDARLAPFRTLRMDSRELAETFPPQQMIKAVADGKASMPSDPLKRAVYQAQLERYAEKQEQKPANPDAAKSDAGKSDGPKDSKPTADDQTEQQIQDLLDMPPEQRVKAFLKMSTDQQRALSSSMRGAQRDEFVEGMEPKQRETMLAMNNPLQVVTSELIQAKILRATYSERQLQEVMSDFWFNHFNVFIGKGADRYLLTSYDRDVIRAHAMGKFEDLLVATAQSPAMLFYLDNWLSVGPDSDVAQGIRNNNGWKQRARINQQPGQAKGKRGGLNENYGRELMELHTLGVNGGYTQQDVTEVARVFTGWTLKQPKQGGGFQFEERMHEPGDKTVLGHRIKPNGEKEGLEVLHILAQHPSTAKFVCTKLAVRFVSDNPPPALVDRMAQTFLKKNGDIREVLKTMFDSPEFWSSDAYRAKVKTPLEFVVSAMRASAAEVDDAMPVAHQLQNMGMPLYGMQPPTGYSTKADAWVNSSALLGRMNFALALSAGKIKGVQVDPAKVLPAGNAPADGQQTLAALEQTLLAGEVSQQTNQVIGARLQDPNISHRKLDDPARPPNIALIEGLLLGSPEFQKR